MKVIAWILRILVLLVLVWLALLNNQTTTFSVMQGLQVDLPLIVLLFAFFVMGLLLGILVLLPMFLSMCSLCAISWELNPMRLSRRKWRLIRGGSLSFR